MANLSYTVETNGDNGVFVEYRLLDFVPFDVVWDSNNTLTEDSFFPDVELPDSPEYLRRMVGSEYEYYRRVISMPAKSAAFTLYVLRDGAVTGFTYDTFDSFLNCEMFGGGLFVSSRTNIGGYDRNGVISVTSNMGGDTLSIPVFQKYVPVRTYLSSYEYEDMFDTGYGDIGDTVYEHTFHWLTSETSPDNEFLSVDVVSTGPRNGFVIRDVSEYVYFGELDDSYGYSVTDDVYYQTTMTCSDGALLTVSRDIIYDLRTQGVYKKTRYYNDLKIVRDGNTIKVVNYGRCFLQEDAYYVITLSNVDDLSSSCRIVIRYVPDERMADCTPAPYVSDLLRFTSRGNGNTLMLTAVGTPNSVDLEYTKNGYVFRPYAIDTLITVDEGEFVEFRHTRGTVIESLSLDENNYYTFKFNGRFEGSGNVQSLLDASCESLVVGNYCFFKLFDEAGETSYNLLSAPRLPATTIGNWCYAYMFQFCKSITEPAQVPATTVKTGCYYYMYRRCENLITPPELPATSLQGATDCYAYMFSGCYNLSYPPELPATVLAVRCYKHMFNSCEHFTYTPDLNATVLTIECYAFMFRHCYDLTDIGLMGAQTLASNCCQSMFSLCTSLETPPELPVTTLAYYCYAEMFEGCSSLKTAPTLNASTVTSYAYSRMFRECTSLTQAPELPATILADSCYNKMFETCTALTTVPLSLPAATLKVNCYSEMFKGCTSLTQTPTLPASTLDTACYMFMFSGCTNLTQAPALNATTMKASCYKGMFSGCNKLTSAPSLNSTNLANNCYEEMFSKCSLLTQVQQTLPATTLKTSCYKAMFSQCTSLVSAPQIAATTLEESCCETMFSSCRSLQTAPALPDNNTPLANYCYRYMFLHCTSLINAPYLEATTLADGCYESMFNDTPSVTSHHVATLNDTSTDVFKTNTSCTSFTIDDTTPPTIAQNTISGLKSDCVIHVPSGCASAYQAAPYWDARAAYIVDT